MRFTNAECLIVRLSFLEFMNVSLISAPSRWGREIMPEPERGVEEDLMRIEGRFLGIVGAWGVSVCED